MKPEIIDDEKTGPLSDSAFRLFVSMILLADDAGNVRADARWLQGQVWWAHADWPDVSALLGTLRSVGLIQVYEVRGGVYAHLNGWAKHQRIDNASQRGRLPEPTDINPDAREEAASPSAIVATKGVESEPVRGEPPRVAASRRSDLDQERDLDLDQEGILAPKNRSKRGSAISVDWQPRDEEAAKAKELGVNVAAEVEQFRDYHTAKGSVFKDWNAAFRTWLRNAKKWQRPQPQRNTGRVEPRNPADYPEGDVTL